jgi:serine/threonine protein kinase
MGVVYAARDPRLQRDVALKLVLSGHRRGQQSMLREARALAKLSHPNVVTIHEVGVHDDQVFVAMELVSGTTLREWLQTPRSLVEIAAVFLQAGEGLAAAHRAGLVHRDFKPDNVLIGDEAQGAIGRVRVVDFGLARSVVGSSSDGAVADGDPVVITRTGEARGTPAYMALEQLSGHVVDARTDIFAYCVALYEALHGRRPYARSTIAEQVAATEVGPAALPIRRDLPRRLAHLLRQGLAADAWMRPDSLAGFLVELRRIQTPPRRRAIAIGGALASLGIGAAIAAQPREPAPAPPADATARPQLPASTEEHICAEPESPDPRSCLELADELVTRARPDDWATRCAYRRQCATPDPSCPDGTFWDGSLGCTLEACEATSGEAALARCESGDVRCCLDSGYARYDSRTANGGDLVDGRIMADVSAACAAGDAFACGALGTLAIEFRRDDDGAMKAWVNACELGFLQACRRVAILPEDREGLLPECTTNPGADCEMMEVPPVQLAHFAACRTVQLEVPASVSDDAFRLSAAFRRDTVVLAAESAALDRAEASFRAEIAADYRSLWHDMLGNREADALSLAALSRELDESIATRGVVANGRAIQRLADARADILPARPAERDSVTERWFELQGSLATRLEEALAREVGPERARERHLELGSWPDSFLFRIQGACPD